MPLHFTFQKGDPLNTVLIREDGTTAYRVQSPLKLIGSKVTTVTRVDRAGVEQNVAVITWEYPYMDATKISLYGGQARKIGTFLEQRKAFSYVRYIRCANGGEYKWVRWSELLDMSNNGHALYQRAKFDISTFKMQKAVLDISLDVDTETLPATQTYDSIVVSLIVMESWRRYDSMHPGD